MGLKRKLDSSPEEKMGEELSEIELLRLKNIEERRKLMSTLGIIEATEGLLELTPTRRTPRPSKKRSTPAKSSPREVLPRREPSRRLRQLAAKEESGKEVTAGLPGDDDEEEEVDSRLLENMPMRIEGEESDELLKRLAEISTSAESGISSAATLSADLSIPEFQKSMMKFRLITDERLFSKRIQSLIVHPTADKKVVISGSTDGNIGIWDLSADLTASFKTHRAPVNCLSVSADTPSKLYSTSHDGVFACGDLEKSIFSNVYATDFDARVRHLTWHDQLDEHQFLLAHGNGNVGLIDTRQPREEISWFECYDRSARTVQHNPVESHYFLVSSGAGNSCKIFDMRLCSGTEPIPVCEVGHPKGLTSAFFSPSGRDVLTTCNDNHIRIYSSGLQTYPALKRVVPHNNHTGRWLSVFKATWFPGRDDVFHVGSLLSPRRIQLYGADGKLVFELKDEEMTTITSLVAAHPKLPLIVGGNSSGRVYAFSPPPSSSSQD